VEPTAADSRGLILAAGKGTRFQTGEPMPKVLRPVMGRPMVSYAIDALRAAGVDDITLVVGFRADDVKSALGGSFHYALQQEQKGSGHATSCAKEAFEGFEGSLVVMCGDSPLFLAKTVRRMLEEHARAGAAVTLAAAVLDEPFGYGRIVRDPSGRIAAIVEEKCATSRERAIREVNGGAYVFDAGWLFANIHLMARNEAGEYNLTDMVRVAVEQGRTASAVQCDPEELLGVNTPEQLSAVEEILRGRQCG
jgi:bifunctional UDP-N-acetylglucosamine pyrophosphorylase/glucosamine-1-phosphate N-acetyltransferase